LRVRAEAFLLLLLVLPLLLLLLHQLRSGVPEAHNLDSIA
jgi:hypothetical protein